MRTRWIYRCSVRVLALLFVSAIILPGLTGCGGLSSNVERKSWPTESALPTDVPGQIRNLEPKRPTLKVGDDGIVYLVASKEDAFTSGDFFKAIYGDEWPLGERRPTLAAGRVIQQHRPNLYSVHVTYQKDDTELDGLFVQATDTSNLKALGKGLIGISQIRQGDNSLSLSAGKKSGLRRGDIYGLLAEPTDSVTAKQLSRRLTGICEVRKVSGSRAKCFMLSENTSHPSFFRSSRASQAVFLEHRISIEQESKKPVVYFDDSEGGAAGEIEERLRNEFEMYFGRRLGDRNKLTKRLDVSLHAGAYDFFRSSDDVPKQPGPSMLVGTSLEEKKGETHLIVNYTGAGSSWGSGMIAAPPKAGVDLGPVEDISSEQLHSFAAVVWAGYLVYRGETSRALLNLRQMLIDGRINGPFRWHLRDQYAMRWVVLGHTREALWLVLQDESIADQRGDREAKMNAFGTRVRLYDFLGLPERAYRSAQTYFEKCSRHKPNSVYLSALAMYAEMAMVAEKVSKGETLIRKLVSEVPEQSRSQLKYYLTGSFWSIPLDSGEGAKRVEKKILEIITENQALDQPPGELAFVRFYQGIDQFRSGNPEQALVALYESARLYEKVDDIQGKTRAKYFAVLTELQRNEPQRAFDQGRDVIELETRMGDFRNRADTYRQLARLYTNPKHLQNPGEWLRSANQILSKHIRHQIALGHFGNAAEGLLNQASFYAKIGRLEQGEALIERAVSQAVSNVRFDVAAMGHLYLAMIAKSRGNQKAFEQHAERARQISGMADDPGLTATIEKVLQSNGMDDAPTTIL